MSWRGGEQGTKHDSNNDDDYRCFRLPSPSFSLSIINTSERCRLRGRVQASSSKFLPQVALNQFKECGAAKYFLITVLLNSNLWITASLPGWKMNHVVPPYAHHIRLCPMAIPCLLKRLFSKVDADTALCSSSPPSSESLRP